MFIVQHTDYRWIAIAHLKMHILRTPREEIAFTAWPKIHFHSQIFRYDQSIFCLPHRPNISDSFNFCLHLLGVCSPCQNVSNIYLQCQSMVSAWGCDVDDKHMVQAHLWACGHGDMSTPSFGSHLNPISTKGRLYPLYTGVHTKFRKPQARLWWVLHEALLCHQTSVSSSLSSRLALVQGIYDFSLD